MTSKSSLAIILSKLSVFESASKRLEQYPTDSEIAAETLWEAYMQGDIEGKIVADLGCGTGILGIGCLLLGASKVLFVERDENAIKILRENLRKIYEEDKVKEEEKAKPYEIIDSDIEAFSRDVEVVVMNPPFGSKNRHADKKFLEKAFEISDTIYSFHIAKTDDFIRHIAEDNGFLVTHFKKHSFPLKNTMEFHKRRIYRIEVGMWRFQRMKNEHNDLKKSSPAKNKIYK